MTVKGDEDVASVEVAAYNLSGSAGYDDICGSLYSFNFVNLLAHTRRQLTLNLQFVSKGLESTITKKSQVPKINSISKIL